MTDDEAWLALHFPERRNEELDLEHPDPSRRLTFEQSMKLIVERYGEALKELAD